MAAVALSTAHRACHTRLVQQHRALRQHKRCLRSRPCQAQVLKESEPWPGAGGLPTAATDALTPKVAFACRLRNCWCWLIKQAA